MNSVSIIPSAKRIRERSYIVWGNHDRILLLFVRNKHSWHPMGNHLLNDVMEYNASHSTATCWKTQFIQAYNHAVLRFIRREITTECKLIFANRVLIVAIIIFPNL